MKLFSFFFLYVCVMQVLIFIRHKNAEDSWLNFLLYLYIYIFKIHIETWIKSQPSVIMGSCVGFE